MSMRGFTLIEMIMAIVITGILAGIVAIFISRPIEGYVDSANRATLTDIADLALKRMSIEIRSSVANSIPLGASGASEVEFIPARTSGRYCSDTDSGCNSLRFTGNNDTFDILGPPIDAYSTDQLVVFNTGQPGLDAYETTNNNRRSLDASAKNGATNVTLNATTAQTVTQLRIAGSAFPYRSPSNRFQVIPASGPIKFKCANNELRRYTGYGYDHNESDATSNALLAKADTLTCAFSYTQVTATNGLLVMVLTLGNAGGTIKLSQQVDVSNTP